MENSDGNLTYAGRVGTGFSEANLTELRRELSTITRKTPPVSDDSSDATWVTPSCTPKSVTPASPATTASATPSGGR